MNTHVAQCVDSGSVSSVYLSSLHPLHKTLRKVKHVTSNITSKSLKCSMLLEQWSWTLTEGISLHAAAALLGRGRLTGPGRAALSPALPRTEEKKYNFYITEIISVVGGCGSGGRAVRHFHVRFQQDSAYLMVCGVSSPPAFDALDRSSSAVLYFLQLE